jgi:hypothetical protein
MPWKSRDFAEWPSSSWQVTLLKLYWQLWRALEIPGLTWVQPNFKGSLKRDYIRLTSLIVILKDYNTPPTWNHRMAYSGDQRFLYIGKYATTQYVDPRHTSHLITYFLLCPKYRNKRQRLGSTTWVIQNKYPYDEVKREHKLNDHINKI